MPVVIVKMVEMKIYFNENAISQRETGYLFTKCSTIISNVFCILF